MDNFDNHFPHSKHHFSFSYFSCISPVWNRYECHCCCRHDVFALNNKKFLSYVSNSATELLQVVNFTNLSIFAICHRQIWQICLWITSFDNQLEISLLTTCNRLVVNWLSQTNANAPWYRLVDNKSVAKCQDLLQLS